MTRAPTPAATALAFQAVGWATQLLAVWAMLYAFEIDLPIEAAALVLVIMNLVMVFPLWPGNVGLVQAAVALSLLTYGVSYGRGFAFGIGVHAVELGVAERPQRRRAVDEQQLRAHRERAGRTGGRLEQRQQHRGRGDVAADQRQPAAAGARVAGRRLPLAVVGDGHDHAPLRVVAFRP